MAGLEFQQGQDWDGAMECQICLNEYSWRRRAKLLACRHTCCTTCLSRMVTVREDDPGRQHRGTAVGTGSSTEQRASPQHVAADDDLERRQRDRHLYTLIHSRTQDEPERGPRETVVEPAGNVSPRRGSQRQTAAGQRDCRVITLVSELGHGVVLHDELERNHRDMENGPRSDVERNQSEREVDADGMANGQRENHIVTQLRHNEVLRDQTGYTAAVTPSGTSSQSQIGFNGMETGRGEVMLRHNDLDSGHHQRNSPADGDAYDIRMRDTARGQPEALGNQTEMVATGQSAMRTNQNDLTSSRDGTRIPEQGETISNPISTNQNEWSANVYDMWPGQSPSSTHQRVIICPWCRGVTVLANNQSVNHLPDDQDKMAAVNATAPPALAAGYTPVFIRLLPGASSSLLPWAEEDINGDQETDSIIMTNSSRHFLSLPLLRDNSLRDSVLITSSAHYLLPAVRQAHFSRGRAVEDGGELRVGQQCLVPRLASGQNQALPGSRDSGTEEVWREGERTYFALGEGLRERGREWEQKTSTKMWTRVCVVIILGLLVVLLACLILHSLTCQSRSFTMISCG